MTVNSKLMDQAIRHAVALERYQQSEVLAIRRVLKSGHDKAVRELERRLARFPRAQTTEPQSFTRIRQMIKATDDLAEASLRKTRKRLVDELFELAQSEQAFAISALQTTVPIALTFNTVPPQLLKSIISSKPFQGELLEDWFSQLSVNRQRGLRRAVNDGLVNGRGPRVIAREVRSVLGTTQRHAESVVRTAVNHVSAYAREEAYAANPDIVAEVRYLATLDARTTDICASLDGQVFKVNEGPRPPMHHQCRSTTVPIVKAWDKIPGIDASKLPPATRQSMNGKVPLKLTYNEWLKTQPASIQNEVLGKGKADLFRRGKISMADLVDRNYNPLTLEQLRARH